MRKVCMSLKPILTLTQGLNVTLHDGGNFSCSLSRNGTAKQIARGVSYITSRNEEALYVFKTYTHTYTGA